MQFAAAIAVAQDGVEQLFQNEVQLPGVGLAGGGLSLQSLGKLIDGDRDPLAELSSLRWICN